MIVVVLGRETFRGACAFLNPTGNLHVHLGVVDEVLQRVGARVEVLQLGVVGDGADSGVEGSHHPADVDRLDVGEVGEDSSSRSAGGLRGYLRRLIIDSFNFFFSVITKCIRFKLNELDDSN